MNKKEPIIIIGASGFGKEVAWLAEDCGREVLGFLDDGIELGTKIYNYSVLGSVVDYHRYSRCDFIIAIGNPRVRKNIAFQCRQVNFGKLIHPNVRMSNSVEIGDGTVICAGNILTADIKVGKHCHINLNCTVGHDTVLSDFNTIAPQAVLSGNIVTGLGVEIGTGAALRQGVVLGDGAMLGMGSVLTKNIPPNVIFLGSPAKYFRDLEEF